MIFKFLYRWFFAIMSGLCVLMAVLSYPGVLAPRQWKTSSLTYGLMAIGWACAFFVQKYCCGRLIQLTPEQLARMRARRMAEVKAWLQRRLSYDDAVQLMKKGVELTGTVRISWHGLQAFEQWYASASTPDTELWLYDTGQEAWENLRGEWGFALKRGEEIVDILMIEEN